MHAELCKDEANVVVDSASEMWDKLSGHISERGLHVLAEKDLLPEVKGIHLKHCVDCFSGKQKKASFYSRPIMKRRHALELVHTNESYMDAKSDCGV